VSHATNADEEKILAKGQALENKLIEIGVKDANSTKGSARITGYVFDAITGEPMPGASIASDNQNSGGVTDKFGYYTLEIPKGLHTLRISSVGMKDSRRQVAVNGDGKLNIELQNFIPSLKAVVIVGNKNSNVKSLQMGVQTINFKALRQTPMAFGEADVMKVVLTLPGCNICWRGQYRFKCSWRRFRIKTLYFLIILRFIIPAIYLDSSPHLIRI
jgi:hypothetical protein